MASEPQLANPWFRVRTPRFGLYIFKLSINVTKWNSLNPETKTITFMGGWRLSWRFSRGGEEISQKVGLMSVFIKKKTVIWIEDRLSLLNIKKTILLKYLYNLCWKQISLFTTDTTLMMKLLRIIDKNTFVTIGWHHLNTNQIYEKHIALWLHVQQHI